MNAGVADLGSTEDAASGRVDTAADARAARWGTLPARPRLEELVEEVETEPARDPDGGRNPEQDWMLRYC